MVRNEQVEGLPCCAKKGMKQLSYANGQQGECKQLLFLEHQPAIPVVHIKQEHEKGHCKTSC